MTEEISFPCVSIHPPEKNCTYSSIEIHIENWNLHQFFLGNPVRAVRKPPAGTPKPDCPHWNPDCDTY